MQNRAEGVAQRGADCGAAKRLVCREEHNHYLKETEQGELDAPLKDNATPIQPLSVNNRRLFEHYKQMAARGEAAPLLVKHNGGSGFMVVADDPILDRTILCECVRLLSCVTPISASHSPSTTLAMPHPRTLTSYVPTLPLSHFRAHARYVGQVDFAQNRVADHNDDIMGLLHTAAEETSLVIVPGEAGNIARFFNGINNHDPERRRNQNVRSARFAIDGHVRVILFACKDIPRGTELLYDYNGRDPQGYPTSHFL